MEPKYVLILDFCVGCLNIIKLTDEELRESENYEDFESFLSTIEEKYGFRLNNCQWMVTENRKRLSKYIFYSSFSLLTFATKK